MKIEQKEEERGGVGSNTRRLISVPLCLEGCCRGGGGSNTRRLIIVPLCWRDAVGGGGGAVTQEG